MVTDSSFADRQEFDLAAFDDKNLECSEGVTVFKVLKSDKIGSLRPALIERFGLQNEKFRLWTVVNRSNKTIRVEQPLTATDEKQCKSFFTRRRAMLFVFGLTDPFCCNLSFREIESLCLYPEYRICQVILGVCRPFTQWQATKCQIGSLVDLYKIF